MRKQIEDVILLNENNETPLFECVKIMFKGVREIEYKKTEVKGDWLFCHFKESTGGDKYPKALAINANTYDFLLYQYEDGKPYGALRHYTWNTLEMYKYLIKEGFLDLT